MAERLPEYRFHIPVVRNSDRQPHTPLAWRMFQDAIRKAFPEGRTGPERVYRGIDVVTGEYEMQETSENVVDLNHQYTVAIPESRVDELRSLLGKVAVTFDQESIYLSVAGYAEMVPASPDGGLADEDGKD